MSGAGVEARWHRRKSGQFWSGETGTASKHLRNVGELCCHHRRWRSRKQHVGGPDLGGCYLDTDSCLFLEGRAWKNTPGIGSGGKCHSIDKQPSTSNLRQANRELLAHRAPGHLWGHWCNASLGLKRQSRWFKLSLYTPKTSWPFRCYFPVAHSFPAFRINQRRAGRMFNHAKLGFERLQILWSHVSMLRRQTFIACASWISCWTKNDAKRC